MRMALGDRRWQLGLLAGLIATAVVVTAIVTWPSSHPAPPVGRPGHQPTSGPQSPVQGAYVGASVRPAEQTPSGRIAAIVDFEKRIGRTLDIAHVYHPWEDPFPSSSDRTFIGGGRVLLLSWGGTPDTRDIAAGRFDAMIRERARGLKALDKPILLSWRGEMDRPNIQDAIHSPKDYIAAWRHIRHVFAQEGAGNVGWAWCPTALGFDNGAAQAFYPGDDQVDWLCVDAYPGPDFHSLGTVMRAFLNWAPQHPKPILIAEFGVPRRPGDQREVWLREAATTVRDHPQIKALVYFDSDDPLKGPRLQFSLDDEPAALRAFHAIVADPYFNPDRRKVAAG